MAPGIYGADIEQLRALSKSIGEREDLPTAPASAEDLDRPLREGLGL